MNAARPWINPQPFRIPPGIVQRIICTDSGQIATSYCRNRALEVFLAEQVPKEDCTMHIRE
jgi:penicillin-binding protein 1B